ncbi:MAG: HPP family protein [Hyphomicrobiales bacterium]|nr:HPP family protein [Hyphomicrobiales bacterium]MCP5371150.1 HPP family protein [Hyphomicrobiales bacterium]
MGLVGWLGQASGVPFLIAPFGASCVLLFAVPGSPLAQPANVIGGHVLATALALALRAVLPPDWWAISLAVGLVIGAMVALRLTHPPAGADPVVVFLADPGWTFLLAPVLAGAVALVAVAALYHRLPPRTAFPMLQKTDALERAGPNP